MDADEILPGLWLGNKHAAANTNFLRKHDIRVVFNCTKQLPFDPTIRRSYRVPVDDNLQPAEISNMETWAPEIIYKLFMERKAGRKVLVHCHAGMQRSAAVVAMYLIAVYGFTADEAMSFIHKKRDIAFTPSANFEPAIRGFETRFRTEMK